MKFQFSTTGLVLAAAGLLTACGGGNSSPAATEQKTGSTTAQAAAMDLATHSLASDASGLNSSDAYVLTPDMAKKSTSTSAGSQKVTRDLQKQPSQAQTVNLGNAPQESITKRDQFNSKSNSASNGMKAKLHQTGFGRPIAATSQAAALHQLMAWTTLSNGNAFGTARFESTDAAGIRLGLLIKSLPNEAMIRVSAAEASTALQLTGAMINQAIAANVAADGDTPSARTYWLPMVIGATADLAIELPAGLNANDVSISLPSLVHMMESAAQASAETFSSKTDCPGRTPDAMCSEPLPPAANAVAAMDFTIPGRSGTFACTGTLLADRGATQQPYFLTAQHCINTQTSASSLTTYWFWRSTACNSGTLRPDYFSQGFVRNGGADLLFTRPELTANASNPIGTDTSFLKLREAPPAGAMFAGWTIGRQAIDPSINLTGLHQPAGEYNNFGDLLRQSTGTVAAMARVSGYFNNNPDFPMVETTTNATRPMYSVAWGSGITELGSSGSALFLNGTTANPQVVGQLWGGSTSCTSSETARDLYGRFDLAYQDGLINWLNPGYRMVFRFYRPTNGTHFFTATVDERDAARANIPSLGYEAPVFMVSPAAGAGLYPVYRFYNKQTGVHFYTNSEEEKATQQANTAVYTYEGIGWFARQAGDTDPTTVPIYRFFRKSAGTHFYTASSAEKDNIIATLGDFYTYEGIAYRAWPIN